MAEHRATTLQLFDTMEQAMGCHGFSIDFIPKLFDMIYPADGVDNIKQTINGCHEAFHSAQGHNFRNDSLTRFSSFLGLPNRQLDKQSSQTWRNILENFTGSLNKPSKKNIVFMLPLNILLTPLRLLLNVVKLITEFFSAFIFTVTVILIHGICKHFEFSSENLLRRLGVSRFLKKQILAAIFVLALSPLIITPALLYLGGCCLTSSYESMRAAWHFGAEILRRETGNRILGFIFVGIVLAVTIVVNIFALPWATKFLIVYALPRITPFLPQLIVNVLNKIGAVIKPVLAVIGDAVAPILKYTQIILPEFVGAGLFGTIIRSLVSPIVNYGIDKIKAWWNYNPEFDEKNEMDILSQQNKMLCDLGAIQEEQPASELYEAINISDDYVPQDVEQKLNPVSDNPSQPLLEPGLNNLTADNYQKEYETPADQTPAAKYSLTPPSSAPSSVLFPPENSLRPPASSDQTPLFERISSRTPSPMDQ